VEPPQLGQQRMGAGAEVDVGRLADQLRRVLQQPLRARAPGLDLEPVAIKPEALGPRPGGRPGGAPDARRGDAGRPRPGEGTGQVERPGEPEGPLDAVQRTERIRLTKTVPTM
jgi:hypothetical protein